MKKTLVILTVVLAAFVTASEAKSCSHYAIRIRKQAVPNVELQIDEENGCTIVDFLVNKTINAQTH